MATTATPICLRMTNNRNHGAVRGQTL